MFRPGDVYGYDVVLDLGPNDTNSLGTMGLLSGDTPLGYEPGWLPSFVLPPSRYDLKLVQAWMPGSRTAATRD